MGQFLAIGMRLRTYIRKEEVNPLFKKLPEEKVFQLIESNYHLAGIYERKEEDDYYVYHLKKELLDKELVPFIEKFYSLRYEGDHKMDSPAVLSTLKELPDTSSRLAILHDRRFQTYQEGEDVDYFYPKEVWTDGIKCVSDNAILSLDGKIIMECYGDLFEFFRRCIVAQLSDFRLCESLTVWIEG